MSTFGERLGGFVDKAMDLGKATVNKAVDLGQDAMDYTKSKIDGLSVEQLRKEIAELTDAGTDTAKASLEYARKRLNELTADEDKK
jgi:hypothetical protein